MQGFQEVVKSSPSALELRFALRTRACSSLPGIRSPGATFNARLHPLRARRLQRVFDDALDMVLRRLSIFAGGFTLPSSGTEGLQTHRWREMIRTPAGNPT